jgi:uncharacterized membrane protein
MICLVVCLPQVHGAQLSGTMFSISGEPMPKVIIRINSTPEQVKLTQTGYYTFQVAPDTYELVVTKITKGIVYELARKTITIPQEGSFTHDILEEQPEPAPLEPSTVSPLWILIGISSILAILSLGLLTYVLWRKKHPKILKVEAKAAPATPQPTEQIMDPRYIRVLKALNDSGGTLTQKDIRKILECSDATVSVLLAEMEEKKLLSREKKGRLNVLKIRPIIQNSSKDS